MMRLRSLIVFYALCAIGRSDSDSDQFHCRSSIAPTTPVDLQARAVSQKIDVSWKHGNEGCVDRFRVRAAKRLGQWTDMDNVMVVDTTENNVTLKDGIENGFMYVISVEAIKDGKNSTSPAVTSAVPHKKKCESTSPGPAQGVTATVQGSSIKLCWNPPKSGGCVEEYRVAARVVPLTNEEMAQLRWDVRKLSTAGCVVYNNLLDRRTYQFAVQSYSGSARSGSVVGTSATVYSRWQCFPVSGYYPICRKAAMGQCNPLSCEEQLRNRQCSSPWLRQRDETTKTVVQYCADFCGCAIQLESDLRNSTSAPAAASSEPQVVAMDEDYDAYGGCCRSD